MTALMQLIEQSRDRLALVGAIAIARARRLGYPTEKLVSDKPPEWPRLELRELAGVRLWVRVAHPGATDEDVNCPHGDPADRWQGPLLPPSWARP